MPRLIFKCPYIKGGTSSATAHLENYVKYMATRNGVERIDPGRSEWPATSKQKKMVEQILRDFPLSRGMFEYEDYAAEPTRTNASEFITRALEDNYNQIAKKDNYLKYIATRPRAQRVGSHGLFTGEEDQLVLAQVAEAVAAHPGNVWLPIISLRREDAARLGYDKAEEWKALLSEYAMEMAEAMKIPWEDFRWYAAFHDEAHHPHIHMVCYDVMMENHGHELRGAACVIHSDQGSQYLSTTFQRLLSDDGFLQSVSDRGNSQDNAPMESFFGRLKCELLDLVALCPDASTVSRMISGYIDAYNHRHYQYALAGLTPSEYYTYVTTGIYPVDNYYGIKATELMPIQALIAARRRAAEEKAKKYREASAKKRAMAQGKKKDPEFVIARDQRILRREIAKWTRSKELALQQISHLREILELSQKARAYLMTASADLILQLYNGENWGAHPELAYIYKMRELF